MVARAEVASSSAPATSGPSGAIASEIVPRTDSTRPSSRSGVIAIRKPWTTESVDGITRAVTSMLAVST